MAHNLNIVNGHAALAYLGSTPWHKLGTPVSPEVAGNFEAMLQAARLDYLVETQPLYLADGRVNVHAQAILRTDTNDILGAVGSKTVAVQNHEALGVLRGAMEQHGLQIEVAGALGLGERVWALGRMPLSADVVDGDSVTGYALVLHDHTNGGAPTGYLVSQRVVCENTLAMALSASHGTAFRVKKTASYKAKLDAAGVLMENLANAFTQSVETFRSLANRRVSPAEVAAFIRSTIQGEDDNDTVKDRRQAIARAVFTSPGADLAKSGGQPTAWSLLNAVTYYFDHIRPQEARSQAGATASLVSAAVGGNNALKLLALAKAQQLVAA